MYDGKDFSELFSDPVLRDYLNLTDKAIRLAVSRISADCEALAEERAKSATAEDIMNMCCRLVQVSELYGMLTRGTARGNETVELRAYLSGFCEGCTELLGGVCAFTADGTDNVYIETARDMLTYILLSFVRKAVLGGATKISAGYTENEGSVKVCLTVTERKEPFISRFEGFQDLYYDEVNGTLCNKLGAESAVTADSFSLTFKEFAGTDWVEMRSPVADYQPETFSPFKVMLGDLTDNDVLSGLFDC